MDIISYIFSYWKHGGYLLIILAGVSIVIIYYFVSNFIKLKRYRNSLKFLILSSNKDIILNQILSKIPDKMRFLTRMISYIITSINKKRSLDSIFIEIERNEISVFKREISILQAFVSMAPLLGLLGTITGMIKTFNVLANKDIYSSQLIADGISQALITTQFGLFIALPGIFGVTLLKRMTRHFQVQLNYIKHHIKL